MKTRYFVALTSILFLGLGAAPATALTTGDYIVTLHSNAALSDSTLSGKVIHDRWKNALNAIRVSLTRDEARALAKNSAVAAVELNQKRQIAATQSIDPNHDTDNWALDALEGGSPAIDGQYEYTTTGSGVTVAVVDTGVFPNADLGGRLAVAKNFVDGANGSGSAKDCHGHGTHVASIAAGTRFGVAKEATVYNLRVLDCYGSGWDADIVDALDWLAANQPAGRTVVNMSIGGGAAYDITAVVDRLTARGVTVAVAAGNESSNACDGMIVPKASTGLPTAGVLTVGAYASNGDISWFSNYGSCVDVFAPGSDILSRTIATDYAGDPIIDPNTGDFIPVNESWSGTSMATPVVVGSVARYLQFNPTATPAQIESAFVANAREGAIDFSASDAYLYVDEGLENSPNLMLDYSSLELPVAPATLSVPSSLTYSQPAAYSITDEYVNAPNLSVLGQCHLAGGLVYADYGIGYCTISAKFAPEAGLAGRILVATTQLQLAVASVGNPITEAGWNSSFTLPQTQTLTLGANPGKVTGGCKVNRLLLIASGSSGTCVLEYKAFNDGYYSYPKTSTTIKLGPATQAWSGKVTKSGSVKYSGRPVQLAANITPTTNYKLVGTWSIVSGPCTLDTSVARNGAMLTHSGLKGQSCVVTLSAPGAFKLPALTNSWTINK